MEPTEIIYDWLKGTTLPFRCAGCITSGIAYSPEGRAVFDYMLMWEETDTIWSHIGVYDAKGENLIASFNIKEWKCQQN